MIKKIRQPIDKGLDKIVAWLGNMLKKLVGKDKQDPRLEAGLAALDTLNKNYEQQEPDKDKLATEVAAVKSKHPVFKTLKIEEDKTGIIYDYTASPEKKKKGPVEGANWLVGPHPADKPKLAKGSGESHHVPAKVLKQWIANVLLIAAKVWARPDLKETAQEYKLDSQGDKLSAIWLSKTTHKAAHAPAKPGQIADIEGEINSDITIRTQEDIPSAKPVQKTITSAIHQEIVDQETSRAKTQKTKLRGIIETKGNKLGDVFRSAFESLLGAGIGFVARAKSKMKPEGGWQEALRSLAKTTWKDILKVPKK